MKIDFLRLFFRFYLRKRTSKKSKKIDMSKVNRILVISNTAIGDTLFATSSIKLIKKNFPEKKLITILNPKNFELFETDPNIDKIELYNGKWSNFFSTVRKLKKHNIDLTFIMNSNEPQATPLSYLIGSKYIIRVPNNRNEFNHLHINPKLARNYSKHTINTRLKQLEFIDIFEEDYNMYLYPKPHWYENVKTFFDDPELVNVGLQAGASTKSRMWENDNWVHLAKQLLDYDPRIRLILTGSKVDENLTSNIQLQIDSNRVLNLAGKFSLVGAAALIDSLDILITPDTGPLHIAGAMNTPTVAFSVAGKALSSKPVSIDIPHVFIQKPQTCSPCIDKRCLNAFCMDQITVDEVFKNVVKILEKRCQ